MRVILAVVCLILAAAAFGQTANSTINGTLTDPTGAVVPNATVEAKNVETGIVYPTQSTPTGNYTISNLPVGQYEVSVNVPGFKIYIRKGIELSAAQLLQVDVKLEVGVTGDTVTVTAEASLLKTETGDLVHNVTIKQLDNLPILGVNGGGLNSSSSGFR